MEVTLTSVPAYDATSVSLRALNDKEEGECGLLRGRDRKLKPRWRRAARRTPKRNMAEKRLKLLAGESRCGCDPPVVDQARPAETVRYALYAAGRRSTRRARPWTR
jgi:hypothetical protein